MIDIEKRKFLYSQLKEIEGLSLKKEAVIEEEEFYSLTDAKLIEYVFKYRDRQVIRVNGKYPRAYIELPDLDMEGIDLTGIEISGFVPGIIENGEIRKSKLNFQNTGLIINMSTIFHNEEQITDNGYKYITDLTGCNFHGCVLYGRTQDEIKKANPDPKKQYTFRGMSSLDERYIKRRKLHQLSQNDRVFADYVYKRLLNQLSLSVTLQDDIKIDLTDYDFSGLSNVQKEKVLELARRHKIILGYTGIDINKFGEENVYTLSSSLKDAIAMEDHDFIRKVLSSGYLGVETRSKLAEKEYHLGNISFEELRELTISREVLRKIANEEFANNEEEFSERNYRLLNSVNLAKAMKKALTNKDYKCIVRNAKIMPQDLANNMAKLLLEEGSDELSDFLLECKSAIYKETLTMIFDKKGLDVIPDRLRTEALYTYAVQEEFKKGNREFVKRYLKDMKRSGLTQLLQEDYDAGNTDLAKENITSAPLKLQERILRDCYKNGELKYIVENLNKCQDDKIKYHILLTIYANSSDDFKTVTAMLPLKLINRMAKHFSKGNNLEALSSMWGLISFSIQQEIASLQKSLGNDKAFEKIQFNGTPIELLLAGYMTDEQLKEQLLANRKKGISGRILATIIQKYPERIDVVRRLILNGEDVNYCEKSNGANIKTPILQLALECKNQNARNDILYELFKANVNTKVKVNTNVKGKQKNRNAGKGYYEGNCEKSPAFKCIVSYTSMMRRFFREEIGLDEEQIKKLEFFYKENNINPINMKTFELNFRKIIFEQYGVTKMIFEDEPQVLLKPLNLLFAQAMFFQDIGKEINQNNFMDTLGLSNKEFLEKFGRILAKGYDGPEEKLEEVVNEILLSIYPMSNNICSFKKAINKEGVEDMILVNEDKKNGDLLRVYESDSILQFTDGKILPTEQRELLIEMLRSSSKTKSGKQEPESERILRERAADLILSKLQDPRLLEKARIYTAYSDGGAQTATDGADKASLDSKNAKVKYLVIDINGVTILEPFGQKNNATFLTVNNNDEEKEKITTFGRKGAVENGFHKVIHEGNSVSMYNYASNHLVRILDMTIENKERMLKILEAVKKDGKKFCNLLTLESKFGAVKLAEEYGLGKEEILSVGEELTDKVMEGEDKDEK